MTSTGDFVQVCLSEYNMHNIICILIYDMLTSVISSKIIFKIRHFGMRLKVAMQIHD